MPAQQQRFSLQAQAGDFRTMLPRHGQAFDIHRFGMHTCHQCGSLQPAEGHSCTKCGAHLACATARSGDPSSFTLPPPAPTPDPPPQPPWGKVPAQARVLPPIRRFPWHQLRPNKWEARVLHEGSKYRLQVQRYTWRVYKEVRIRQRFAEIQLGWGHHSNDPLLARFVSQRFLNDHLIAQ